MKRWRYQTLDGTETYEFEMNPNQAENPWNNRPIDWHLSQRSGYSGARTGQTPVQWGFSGTMRTAAQYQAFVRWLAKSTKIRLITDLGETHLIRLTSFEPSQQGPTSNIDRYTYNVKALLYDEVGTRPVNLHGPTILGHNTGATGSVGTGVTGPGALTSAQAPAGGAGDNKILGQTAGSTALAPGGLTG